MDGTLDELVLTGTLPSQLLTSAVPSAEVELLGDLEVRASLGLRAGNPFALTASWHSPLEQAIPLDVVLSTESGNVRIDLSSEELEGAPAGLPVLFSGTACSSRGRGPEEGRNSCHWLEIDDRGIAIERLEWSRESSRFVAGERRELARRGARPGLAG